MNRYIKTALYYAVFGLAAGVFYREFTKYNGVDGGTALAFVHGHTIILGMVFFLMLSLLEDKFRISTHKRFNLFNISYNLGLIIMIGMFLVRGITEVLGSDLSRGMDKALSGIAGLGHMSLALGLITMLLILNQASKQLDLESKK